MIDRSHYAPIENEIRSQLAMVIQILQPYARSSGPFNDWRDLRTAIGIALQYVERAQLLANHRLPPTP
jgi:hypothetical protein